MAVTAFDQAGFAHAAYLTPVVPEPCTALVFGLALPFAGWCRRRKAPSP